MSLNDNYIYIEAFFTFFGEENGAIKERDPRQNLSSPKRWVFALVNKRNDRLISTPGCRTWNQVKKLNWPEIYLMFCCFLSNGMRERAFAKQQTDKWTLVGSSDSSLQTFFHSTSTEKELSVHTAAINASIRARFRFVRQNLSCVSTGTRAASGFF